MMLILSMNGLEAFALTSNPTNSGIIIEIKPTQPKNPTIKPRNIVDCDIEANCYAGALTFIFNNDLGRADITVTNLSTGEMWMESANGICITSIYISNSEGYFVITIETDSGIYSGDFVVE